jgi:serine/threonine protein phosphatase PrpC
MSQRFQLDVGFLSDVGQVRELNEDCWGLFEALSRALELSLETMERKGRLYAVADGMGGHAAGEVASKRAITVLFQQYYGDPDVDLVRSLERAFLAANAEIYAQAATHPEQSGMGTTLVAAVVQDDELVVANVGDSRAYLIRDGQAEQISHDHSWVNEQVEAGLLTESEAQTHIYRNIITRSLGSRPDVPVDTFSLPLQVGDAVFLCTDGVSNEVRAPEIGQIISEATGAEQAAASLIATANRRGGADNLTAIVIRVAGLQAERAGSSWWVTGALGGAVLVGALVVCLAVGLLPTALRPRFWQAKATPGYTPTPVIVVVDTASPQTTDSTAPPISTLVPDTATLPLTSTAPVSLAVSSPLSRTATFSETAVTVTGAPTLLPVFNWKIVPPTP